MSAIFALLGGLLAGALSGLGFTTAFVLAQTAHYTGDRLAYQSFWLVFYGIIFALLGAVVGVGGGAVVYGVMRAFASVHASPLIRATFAGGIAALTTPGLFLAFQLLSFQVFAYWFVAVGDGLITFATTWFHVFARSRRKVDDLRAPG